MNRFTRKLASLLGIVAVIFAQLAVSAHACPLQFMGQDAVENSAVAPDANSNGRDSESPNLCQKHCENGQQNINDTPQPLAFVSPAPAFIVTLMSEPVVPLLATAPARALQHATSPPHAIRNCCFRI